MFHIGICDAGKEAYEELKYIVNKYCTAEKVEAEIILWSTVESCYQFIRGNKLVDIIILDLDFLGDQGLEIGRFIRETLENTEVIILYLSSESSCALQLFQISRWPFFLSHSSMRKFRNQ